MPSIRHTPLSLLLPLAFALAVPAGRAAPPEAPLPSWDQLTDAQRETLVAPVRQRWDDNPGKRARILAHAERCQQMDRAQRERARRGAERWRQMDPEKREAMRALYARLRSLPEAEREELREEWRAMTPEQRRAWVKANPPPERRDR